MSNSMTTGKVIKMETGFNPVLALQAALMDPLVDVEHPPTIIEINRIPCMTAGSFSVLIGKAKARKGFFAGAITAAAASGSCSIDGIKGHFNNGKNVVMYFDTEQGAYWGQIAHKRIVKSLGIDSPQNLRYYDLQQYRPPERLKMIDTAIMAEPDLSLVVIDGIRDLISSINDESEATDMTSQILKWCAVKQVHVITILHQNKTDFNARGHIGTELINKAEATISVTKEQDDSISTVKLEFCRGKEFKPFSFTVDYDTDLPVITDTPEAKTGPKSNKSSNRDKIIRHIMKGQTFVRNKYLVDEYKELANRSERTAKDHIVQAVIDNILHKDENGFYSLVIESKKEDDDEPFPF